MDATELLERAHGFGADLKVTKERIRSAEWSWYPYDTLANLSWVDRLLSEPHRRVLDFAGELPVLDIGAADGDLAFLLESLGCEVDVVDFAPTNFNGCRGLYALRDALGSTVRIEQRDLDSQFELPHRAYGLVMALGLLYHLKNPYYFLERLAQHAQHALLSTRIASHNVPPEMEGRVKLRDVPVAYLVAPHETNNDPTNFWILSEAGLRRLLDRTGWDILDYISVGATEASDPATGAGDERAFALLRSRVVT